MALLVTCSGCRRSFRAKERYRDKQMPCPHCALPLTVAGDPIADYDAFISYSSKDKLVADRVCHALEAARVRCWVAPRDIVAGSDWGASIVDAIGNCRLMVLVFSAHSNASQQVVREIERAVSKGLPVVPFRIEDVPLSKNMEYFISASHWLDATAGPVEGHLASLVRTADALLGAADGSRPARAVGPAVAAAVPRSPHVSADAASVHEPGRRAVRGRGRRFATAAALCVLLAGAGAAAYVWRDQWLSAMPFAQGPAKVQPAPAATEPPDAGSWDAVVRPAGSSSPEPTFVSRSTPPVPAAPEPRDEDVPTAAAPDRPAPVAVESPPPDAATPADSKPSDQGLEAAVMRMHRILDQLNSNATDAEKPADNGTSGAPK